MSGGSFAILSTGNAGGSFGANNLHRLGTRQTSAGITVRIYEASLPTPTGARNQNGPIPTTCFPDRQLVVEYSTPEVAGTVAFASRHDQPYPSQGQVTGVAESKPIGFVTALVPKDSQRVTMHFTGGGTDSSAPLSGGWVVLASPLKKVPGPHHPVPLLNEQPAPLGRLSVIDHRGHSHALGTVPQMIGGFSNLAACFPGGPSQGIVSPPLTLPQPTGKPPADAAAARQAIEAAYHRLFEANANGDPSPDIEGGPPLSDAEQKHLQQAYGDIIGKLKVRVNDFRFLSSTEATVNFDLLLNGQPITATTIGRAVLVNGGWKVARATFCDIVGRGGIHCT